MPANIKEKLNSFLQWYQDLYGKEIYIDPGALVSSIEKFKEEIEDCSQCQLSKTRINFVFGDGNENADIMFIGEAPGRDEDLQGTPFVGRSGQLLNRMLAQLKMKRSDVYIANILKCRPPNNRDPLPQEVETCIPFLHRQIELVKPKILIALGRVAAQNLLKTEEALGKMRGRIHSYQNIPLVITYHPAFILRNGNYLSEGIKDLQMAIEYIKN